MAENIKQKNIIPKGYIFSGINCGINPKKSKNDLALFFSDYPCKVSALFTKNLAAAAPVVTDKKHLLKTKTNYRAIIVNSGNANACTGRQGLINSEKMCSLTAKTLNLNPGQVLVSSTGVIGRHLPIDKIETGIKKISKTVALKQSSPKEAVAGIMTTDTFPKVTSQKFQISNFPSFKTRRGPIDFCTTSKSPISNVLIWGCAKGAGMIHPDMATMLCYLFTDANITGKLLDKALKNAVNSTFNSISVDGDTSTNDTVILMANAAAKNKLIDKENSKEYKLFADKLYAACFDLAKMIIKDGEGATKFVTIKVLSAKNETDAKKVAATIATSPLVKTAIFGADPNWGRIIAAAGRSGASFNPEQTDIFINNYCVLKKGTPTSTSLKIVSKSFKSKEIEIILNLHCGKAQSQYYTCDLTYDYVKINADYTT
ncbi:MAG: hypothetical protein A2252_00950 [Elusimicrobia bacterium RIFOXYA2_FULL_39_19]|nr:MAG: hypothetical protein A2252_00950 [Elusimicrobia bacterium RIFOXYA2_FULL_39_19]